MTRGRWMVKRALVLKHQIYFRLSNSLALTLLAQILFICEALEILIIRDLNKKKIKKRDVSRQFLRSLQRVCHNFAIFKIIILKFCALNRSIKS